MQCRHESASSFFFRHWSRESPAFRPAAEPVLSASVTHRREQIGAQLTVLTNQRGDRRPLLSRRYRGRDPGAMNARTSRQLALYMQRQRPKRDHPVSTQRRAPLVTRYSRDCDLIEEQKKRRARQHCRRDRNGTDTSSSIPTAAAGGEIMCWKADRRNHGVPGLSCDFSSRSYSPSSAADPAARGGEALARSGTARVRIVNSGDSACMNRLQENLSGDPYRLRDIGQQTPYPHDRNDATVFLLSFFRNIARALPPLSMPA